MYSPPLFYDPVSGFCWDVSFSGAGGFGAGLLGDLRPQYFFVPWLSVDGGRCCPLALGLGLWVLGDCGWAVLGIGCCGRVLGIT